MKSLQGQVDAVCNQLSLSRALVKGWEKDLSRSPNHPEAGNWQLKIEEALLTVTELNNWLMDRDGF